MTGGKKSLYHRLGQAELSWDLGENMLPDLSAWNDELSSVFDTPQNADSAEADLDRLILAKLSKLVRLQRNWIEDTNALSEPSIWSTMKCSPVVSALAEARWPADNQIIFTDQGSSSEAPPQYVRREDACGQRWTNYCSHLEERCNRNQEDIVNLDGESGKIVSAVLSPTASRTSTAHHVLVVGYTQSGKTQNFLGVASRLADAGYRLIVILSGRTEILGAQTQRRVDRDLVGHGGAEDGDLLREYDDVQRRFSKNPRIGSTMAWRSLSKLVDGKHRLALEGLQAHSPEHLTTYVVVCKKTRGDLRRLTTWVQEQVVAGRSNWPAVIIDEEADDASPDTKQQADSSGWIAHEEPDDASFVHKSILELRDEFKVRKYIGYTATPYANCLADPDSAGLFPDAIYVMKMPTGYFGSHKVFDFISNKGLASKPEQDELTNESIHVEEVSIDTVQDADLARGTVLKSWLVAGIIKEHRRNRRGGAIAKMLRHHSLLVNVASSKVAHEDEKAAFKKILASPNFSFTLNRTETIAEMLWQWYLAKFQLTTQKLLTERGYGLASIPGQPPLVPNDMPSKEEFMIVAQEVIAFLRNQFAKREDAEDYPLQIVNSKPGTNEPNYDSPNLDAQKGLWIILIGGNKLSRGFTVEGLTTTYFGRVSKTVDTMLQQARWNGFRAYYEDVIRLYFQRISSNNEEEQPLSLFRGAALTEFNTREILEKYSTAGDQRISPKEFLPGISSEGKRAPTNRTKMRGAVDNNGFEVGKVWGLGISKRHAIDEVILSAKPLVFPCGCDFQRPETNKMPLEAKLLSVSDVLKLFDAITESRPISPVFRENIGRSKGSWIAFIENGGIADSERRPRRQDIDLPGEVQAGNIMLRDGTFNAAVEKFRLGVCPACAKSQIPRVAGAMFVVSNAYIGFNKPGTLFNEIPNERQYGMRVEFSGGAEFFSGRSRNRSERRHS
jgi:hypothetical protein